MLQLNPEIRPGKNIRASLAWLVHSAWGHRWSIVGLVLLVSALGYGLGRWIAGPEVVVYPVVRGDLVKTVVASGHVETPFRVNIGSQITGTVQDVLVDEGQT